MVISAALSRKPTMASRLERPRGWIMKQALSAWIDQEEECNRLTREAMADVDAGHVIAHQAVQTWADGLATDKRSHTRRRKPGAV